MDGVTCSQDNREQRFPKESLINRMIKSGPSHYALTTWIVYLSASAEHLC